MSSRNALLTWTSVNRPIHVGAELLPSGLGKRSLGNALTELASQVANAQFLIVNVASIDSSRVRDAIAAYLRAGGTTRLCLTGDRRTLIEVDALGLDNERIGLMLDDVNADTPWSDFVWDRIEAVRFNSDFLDRAGRDMRIACVLESMLALAREIGMRTLSGSEAPRGASVLGRYDFDYAPMTVDFEPRTGLPGSLPDASRSGYAVAAGR